MCFPQLSSICRGRYINICLHLGHTRFIIETMENKPHYALSVRELVEAALPQGDLVLMPSSGRRLQEGTRLHQQYQQQVETPGYQAEVPLCYTLDTPHLALDISGRIDGLIEDCLLYTSRCV